MSKHKLIRITTVPVSLEKLLENQLTFMSNYFDIIAISSDKERLIKFGNDNKVKTKYINLTRQITPIQDLKTLWQMYWFFKKEKPFIVHTHTPKAGLIGMLAAKFAGVPNRLHTIAGLPLLETSGLKRKILNLVEKITYTSATKIYPNSYGLKQIIIQQKFTKKEKLKVIANGSSNGINTNYFNATNYLDIDKEKLKKNLNISNDDFVFIFVGRLVTDKGINELVYAFDKLNQKYKKIKLLLVGILETKLDPLKKESLSLIKTNKNIISIGYQQDVRPYFAISDILTFPSYREGLPNVVLQAGAMGLPSIVTDIIGSNEIIKDNQNGLIIPVKNKIALFKTMNKFLINLELKDKLAKNTRNNIVNRYQQQTVWKAILEEYKILTY